MTGPVYGRGRPPAAETFTAERQDAYLALVASGVRLGEAAAEVGIPRRTISAHARRDLDFADRLDAAKTRGRETRIPHGEPKGYDSYGCRCGPCTKASSQARGQRGGRGHTAEEGGGDPVARTRRARRRVPYSFAVAESLVVDQGKRSASLLYFLHKSTGHPGTRPCAQVRRGRADEI